MVTRVGPKGRKETAGEYIRRTTANKNMLVPIYLMLSYLYYERDESIVPDTLFDEVCKRLLDEWEEIEHWHKPLVDKGGLSAGTGYHLKYPPRVVHAGDALLQRFS